MCVDCLTLTEGQNTVMRVEVKMSDGNTHVSSTIPPDIAHIVSMMPPEIFTPKSLTPQVCFVSRLFRRVDTQIMFCPEYLHNNILKLYNSATVIFCWLSW